MTRARGWRLAGRLALGASAAGFACLAYTWILLPDVRRLRTEAPDTTAFMALRAREALAATGRPARRVQRWLPLRQMSPALVRAVVVAEDGRFWTHGGVDGEELRLALADSWARRTWPRGASTITQQLAKNLYLSPSRNPLRKFEELLIARRLEAELSKSRILELYLNLIEWGDGIWGAEAASRTYFGVSASAVSPEQAALLAGAIINARIYSPARPNARLKRRQHIVLERMGGADGGAPLP